MLCLIKYIISSLICQIVFVKNALQIVTKIALKLFRVRLDLAYEVLDNLSRVQLNLWSKSLISLKNMAPIHNIDYCGSFKF